jgi:hypothetical protein
MTKKVLGIAYNKIPMWNALDQELYLWIGTIADFKSREILQRKNGFIEVNNDELPVKKYKKLAEVLVGQGLLKKNAISFRLDEVLGFAEKTKKKVKKIK